MGSATLSADKVHDRLDVEIDALFERLVRHKVPFVDDRSGEAVGKIILADGGNGDVELHGVDPLAEDAFLHPALQQAADHVDELAAG